MTPEMAEMPECSRPGGPLFPDVEVKLTETDGNAFAVMGAVTKALKRAGYEEYVEDFRAEAVAGDYDHLLRACMRWVDVS